MKGVYKGGTGVYRGGTAGVDTEELENIALGETAEDGGGIGEAEKM